MTEPVTLTIDGRQVSVPPGTLVVDAAAALGIEIPVFCSHPKLDPVACCRMCLVEIEGPRGPQLLTACSVPVAKDMVVRTDTPQVKDTQDANLAFLLLNHPLDCPICDKGGECPLQDQTMRFGPGISQLVEPKRRKKKHYLISDAIVLDQERCVVCWRCIRYLQEWEDKPQLALFERGGETIIDIQEGHPVDAKTGGNIIDICPVGALTNRVARFAYRPWEIERTPSICNLCSVGCNMRLDTRTHALRRVIGRENMQVNDQWICDKGRFANAWVNSPERLTMPLLRKEGELIAVSWQEAIQYVADRLRSVKRQHGADSIGGIGSAKLSNENNYALQRFMRQIIGTNNIDHRDGGDVAALPNGLPALTDVMKPQYGPAPQVANVLLFGLDPSEELPILDLHLKRAVRRGGVKLIIAHPRQVELTRYGGPYLAYRPGSEAMLLNGLVKAVLAAQPDATQTAPDVSDEQLRQVCGVDPADVTRAAELLTGGGRTLIIYGPMAARGVHGALVRDGLNNLALVSGNAAPDGLSPAYVGLDANSQGCRDMGVLPDRLPGHAAPDDEAARARLHQLWGGATPLPATPGKSYSQMLDAAGEEIKALFVMGADPASERFDWAEKLGKLDLLVVQELFLTETAAQAHVVLPAVSWAEADGTFTNLERRVQRAPRALRDPQSKAAPDWMILDHLANSLGVNWPFADERAITHEISQAVSQYAGMTWGALGDQGMQWGAAELRTQPDYRPLTQPEAPQTPRAFTLVTGTVLFDNGTMFYRTEALRGRAFGVAAGLHPDDAATLHVDDGAAVIVRSDYGELTLAVKLDARVQPGSVWIPESGVLPVGNLSHGENGITVDIALAE